MSKRHPTKAEVDARLASYDGFFKTFTPEQLDAIRKGQPPHPEILGSPTKTNKRDNDENVF